MTRKRKQKQFVYQQILNYLEESKVTREDFAEMVGISEQALSNVFNGRSNFSFKSLDKIGRIMGCNLTYVKKD
jgi:transcriptional regulator with XRE-family HTH domain